MKFPDLNKNEFAVVMADNNTGIILDTNQKLYRNNSGNSACSIFENINDARDFIEKIAMTNDKIEFMIYDYNQQLVDIIKAKAY